MHDGEDDLLAPTAGPGDPREVPETHPAAGGFGDTDGIVRVWLDDGRLTKVRVSPLWHARLGSRTLAERFSEALALANVQGVSVASVPTANPVELEDAQVEALPRITTESFAVIQTLFSDVQRRWGEALQSRGTDQPGVSRETVATYRGVTVSLDEEGRARRVQFDPAWLESAQAGTICTHVLRAAEAAHALFGPVEEDDSALEALREEHVALRAMLEAMLNPRP